MEQVNEFLANPMVAPLWLFIILAVLNFALKVFASAKPGWPGNFDWGKLPQVLDTMVLRKVIPLAALGIATYFAPTVSVAGIDFNVSTALSAMYLGGCAVAILGELGTLREAFPQQGAGGQ